LTESDGAVHSFARIGNASLGAARSFKCPPGTMITGFSAGATPDLFPDWGRIVNLQLLCQDPVAELKKVRDIQNVSVPCVPNGKSCDVYVTTSDPADSDWWTLAAKMGTNPMELLRANPQVEELGLGPGKMLFVPPCIDGGEFVLVGSACIHTRVMMGCVLHRF
jgi:hypothetical protein